jgi:DNA-binding GntR family transcriptional regulator
MAYEATTDTDGGAGAGAVVLDGRTLRERVYDYIRDEILAERLAPGSELREVALAQSLGVSRGPVREALGRLEAAGLVTIRPRRGAVVRSLSAREFLEAYQLREVLEVMAVRLAVPRLEEGGFARLEALIDEMGVCAEAGDAQGLFAANAAFHELFFESSGNGMLQDTYRQVRVHLDRHRLRSLQLRGNLQRSISEHEAILRAARQRDAEGAAQLVAEHIRVPQMRLIEEQGDPR